jgi:hypothetical protein
MSYAQSAQPAQVVAGPAYECKQPEVRTCRQQRAAPFSSRPIADQLSPLAASSRIRLRCSDRHLPRGGRMRGRRRDSDTRPADVGEEQLPVRAALAEHVVGRGRSGPLAPDLVSAALTRRFCTLARMLSPGIVREITPNARR